MIQGRPVNLTDMLAAREERARQQHDLRQAWNLPLLSFCLNIPGPVKTTPLSALRPSGAGLRPQPPPYRRSADGADQVHAPPVLRLTRSKKADAPSTGASAFLLS